MIPGITNEVIHQQHLTSSRLPAPNGTLVHAMPRTGNSAEMPVDPFGHHWSVTTHIRDVTPQEISQAVAQMDFGAPKCG